MVDEASRSIVEKSMETLLDPDRGIRSALINAVVADGYVFIPFYFDRVNGTIKRVGASKEIPKEAAEGRMRIMVDENLNIIRIYFNYSQEQVSDTGHRNLQETQRQYRQGYRPKLKICS